MFFSAVFVGPRRAVTRSARLSAAAGALGARMHRPNENPGDFAIGIREVGVEGGGCYGSGISEAAVNVACQRHAMNRPKAAIRKRWCMLLYCTLLQLVCFRCVERCFLCVVLPAGIDQGTA